MSALRPSLLAMMLVLVLAGNGLAQMVAGSPGGTQPSGEHAWAVTPSTTSSEWALWHVPPRVGTNGAADGAIRVVDSLERRPAAVAAAGGRVWLAFAGIGNEPGYGIFTAAVQPGAIDGTWYSGSGGRLASSSFLPTEGRLVAMAARSAGPMALVKLTNGAHEVAWLDRGRWMGSAGPVLDDAPSPQAIGVSRKGVVKLAAIGDGAITLWTAQIPTEESDGPSGFQLRDPSELLEPASSQPGEQGKPIELEWARQTLLLPTSATGSRVIAGPVSLGPRVLLAASQDGKATVFEIEGQAVRPVYAADGAAVAFLTSARRGIYVRLSERPESAEGRAATSLELEEFSLDSGRTLYVGPAVFDGPVSPSDLRILLVLMVLVSASLLLFVVRTSNESKPFTAPPGCVLAPPMPRLLASVGDGLVALLIGSEIARALPEGWLAMRIGAEVIDFAPLLLSLVFGMLAGAVMEAALGRTIGKLVFGLAVTRSRKGDDDAPGIRRPGFGASLVRNAVKWLLPLVAMAGAMSPLLRHRGDTLSGLAVVGEFAPDDEAGDSDQDSTPDGR